MDISIDSYTHNLDNYSFEVILVGVDAERVGFCNTMDLESFDTRHVTNWFRKRYHFVRGTVYGQLPRQGKYYPQKVLDELSYNNCYLTEITVRDDTVFGYYLKSEDDAIVVEWDVLSDDWKMREETVSLSDDYSITDDADWFNISEEVIDNITG